MMVNYIYDGSFQGFLTVCYDALENRINPGGISITENYHNDLFSEIREISPDRDKSAKLINYLKKRFDYETIQNVYYSFLSECSDIEKAILDYILLCFKFGKNVDGYHSNDCVKKINEAVRKVTCEKHKFIGIIRFKLLKDGIFYASIEPDNNITGLLINHFKKRFSCQKWLIHDIKRNIGAIYNLKTASLVNIENYDKNILSFDNDSGVFHEDEIEFQNLWKTYFKNICIKERINPRLQRQFIPVRYWKYLVEKQA